MDSYDISAEYLRARVEEIAQEVTQQLQSRGISAAAQQPFFISDIVHAVENAVGGVVNATHDAVNAAVNVTHNLVNVAENLGEHAIHATQNLVNAVTAHTQQVVQVANFATQAVRVATFITGLIGGELQLDRGGEASSTGMQASAAELIQARRAIILQQRTETINNIAAKRAELKGQIEAIAARLGRANRSSIR